VYHITHLSHQIIIISSSSIFIVIIIYLHKLILFLISFYGIIPRVRQKCPKKNSEKRYVKLYEQPLTLMGSQTEPTASKLLAVGNNSFKSAMTYHN